MSEVNKPSPVMKKLISTALLCISAAAPAFAQSSRYYGAVDYGTVNLSGPGSYSSPGALTLSGGFRVFPNLAAEAGLTMMGNVSADVPGPGRVSISQTIVSAVAVGYVPINNSLNLFGKAGIGLHNGEVNGLPDDLIFGFGAQILIDRQFSGRIQYESMGRVKVPSSSHRADMTRLSVGVAMNF